MSKKVQLTIGNEDIYPITDISLVAGLEEALDDKADKTATVSNVAYNTSSKKITKTINGSTTDVVTASTLVTDGGGVKGPSSSTTNRIATFSDTTGKLIKDSGYTIATSVPSGAVFTDTTYTFAGGTNSFTVTPSGGTAQTITVTPSIENNVIQDTPWEESGRVVITGDGENSIAQSSYTIESSVPANAVFTDTKVTSSANHYTPATVSGQDKTASASGATAAWSIDVVKGVTLNTDGKGHVTGLSVTSGKIPANPVPTFASLTLSKTAQAYDGTHTLALPSTDPYTTARTPSSHTHGNIQNGGTLQTTDVAIASGDKLVVTDASDGNKIARTSLSFDGSTATKCLTQKGTWESFTNNAGTITGITMNGASKGTSGVVDLGSVITYSSDEEHAANEIVAFSSAGTGSSVQSTGVKVESKAAASGGTDLSFVTTGEKYTWNSKSTVPTNHASTAATYGLGTTANYGHVKTQSGDMNGTSSTNGIAAGLGHTHSQYLTAHQAVTLASGTNNGTLKITTAAGTTDNIAVKGLGSAAYKAVGSVASGNTGLVTGGDVYSAIDALPEPMIFKGSLGTGGTITALPTASSANEGFTYKVITAGTYASQAAKIGDLFISNGSSWVWIPSGDEPSGTVTSVTLNATGPISIDSTAAITTSGTRTLSHANSGVTAGTYKSVTVNATGHVTAGTNPTTLAGYGITDAKIASGVITLGSNSIAPVTIADGGDTSADHVAVFNDDGSTELKDSGKTLSDYLPLAGGKMTGDAPQSFTPNKIAWDFRPDHASYYCRAEYMTAGNEAMIFANKNAVTSFIYKCGYELPNGSSWNTLFNDTTNIPSVQIKGQSLYVNSFINTGVSPSYNLYVGGTAATSGNMTIGGDARISGNDLYVGSASNSQCHQQYDATNKCLKFIFD